MNYSEARERVRTLDPIECGWDIADARAFIEGYEQGVKESANTAEHCTYSSELRKTQERVTGEILKLLND